MRKLKLRDKGWFAQLVRRYWFWVMFTEYFLCANHVARSSLQELFNLHNNFKSGYSYSFHFTDDKDLKKFRSFLKATW